MRWQRRLAPVLGTSVLGTSVLRRPVRRTPVLGSAMRDLPVLLLRRRAELVVRRAGLRRAVLVLRRLVLILRCTAVLVLGLVLVARLVLRLARLVLVLRRLVLVGRRRLLLLRRTPLVLGLLLRRTPLILGRLGHPPRVGRLLLVHRRLAPVLRLPVLRLPLLGPAVRWLAVLPVLGLAVLVLPLGRGRPPRVRLLLRRAPRVLRLPGRSRLLVLGALLPVRVVGLLRLPVLGLTVLGLPVRWLAVLARSGRRGHPRRLLVVVPARALPGGTATARQIGPAVHAEQIVRLVCFVTDRTVQGRHDTSPERTPARSSLDVRCSISPLRGIPM
ncbi:hypothetical protein [Actinomadura formosensis]|uniref:hypothetical protein n=1 Tax=Actinomadura formosensis TaxID=60706 RepID=UPI0008364DCD|nr:hypothetical protein [Actinomadura formosensis]